MESSWTQLSNESMGICVPLKHFLPASLRWCPKEKLVKYWILACCHSMLAVTWVGKLPIKAVCHQIIIVLYHMSNGSSRRGCETQKHTQKNTHILKQYIWMRNESGWDLTKESSNIVVRPGNWMLPSGPTDPEVFPCCNNTPDPSDPEEPGGQVLCN